MSEKTVGVEEIPQEYMGLGGRGLTSVMINEEVPPTCDPLGPENKLIFAIGLLTGTTLVNTSRVSVGAKSRDDAEALLEFAREHPRHPEFQKDIRDFIYHIFDIAIAAIQEYDTYKKRRGLIDYTDMEVLVSPIPGSPP